MKTSPLTIAAYAATLFALLPNTLAFSTTQTNTASRLSPSRSPQQPHQLKLNMFSGSSLDVEEEEDDEKREQIEKMAKAMGMTVEEYQLGMNARTRMETAINEVRVIGGDPAKGVSVERDGNMPPKHLVVTVTEEGKALGKEKLEKMLVEALKGASEKGKVARDEAQKDMMKYISESMKKMGAM
ncbi:hypothetical protein ACHAXS_006840 [Conticribra weissflogii]